jgi:hypothetical protein
MNTDKVPEHFKADVEKARSLLKKHGCREIYLCESESIESRKAKSVIELGVRGLEPHLFYHAYGEVCFELEHRSQLIDFGTHRRQFDFLMKEGACFQIG